MNEINVNKKVPEYIIIEYELLNTIIYLTDMYYYDKKFGKKYCYFTSLELEYFYNSNIFDDIELENNKEITEDEKILTRKLIDKKYKGKYTFKSIYENTFKVCLSCYDSITYKKITDTWKINSIEFLKEFNNFIEENEKIYGKYFHKPGLKSFFRL